MSFPTKQGLSNYLRNHRRQVIVEAAAVLLPMPATRQRLRNNPAPIPTRGGDAQVPVVQAVDVPRIPAGNRPPDTGGSVSISSGSASSIPAGTRPLDTSGALLSRTPSMQPTSTRRATPVRPRGVEDRLSLPLQPPSSPRHESPRNEGYDIVVANPDFWRPRDPSPASSSSSASSGVAADGGDMLGVSLPSLDADSDGVDGDEQIFSPDDTARGSPAHFQTTVYRSRQGVVFRRSVGKIFRPRRRDEPSY